MAQREVRHGREQGWPWGRGQLAENVVSLHTALRKKSCSFSSAHTCNSQWYREPVLLSQCDVLCQLCMADLVSESEGASREASPALVLLRQERGAAQVVLSVDLRVTLVSLSNQS